MDCKCIAGCKAAAPASANLEPQWNIADGPAIIGAERDPIVLRTGRRFRAGNNDVDKIRLLQTIALFDGMTAEDLAALAAALKVREFGAGEAIFAQGDAGSAMYIVASGAVNIHLAPAASNRISLEDLGPGGFFGELGLFDEKPRSASATATVDTVLLELQHATLVTFLERRPQAALAILRVMSGRLRETNTLLSARAAVNVDEEFDRRLSWSDRLADAVAELNGSWKFILLIIAITAIWCVFNSNLIVKAPIDPYPYQFFNLALGILVGLQGPLIVMSQNRQARKDRARADTDYRVNLKNEVNIEAVLRELDALRAEVRGVRSH